MTKKFANEEEAKQYAVKELEGKYGETFIYEESEKENFKEYPTKTVFTGEFYPESNQEKITFG